MRRVLVTVFLALVTSSAVATAGASTIHFGTYGNYQNGDCTVVAIANMEEAHFGHINLKVSEVLKVWKRTHGEAVQALNYVQIHGLAKHTPSNIAIKDVPSRALILRALRGGKTVEGFFGSAQGFDGGHIMAIIKADAKSFTVVAWGVPTQFDWWQMPDDIAIVTWAS